MRHSKIRKQLQAKSELILILREELVALVTKRSGVMRQLPKRGKLRPINLFFEGDGSRPIYNYLYTISIYLLDFFILAPLQDQVLFSLENGKVYFSSLYQFNPKS